MKITEKYITVGEAMDILQLDFRMQLDRIIKKGWINVLVISPKHKSRSRLLLKSDVIKLARSEEK